MNNNLSEKPQKKNKEQTITILIWMVRIEAIISAILFFGPYCTLSRLGQSITFTGKDIVWGLDYQSGNILLGIWLVLPLIIVFLERGKGAHLIRIICSGGQIISFFYFMDTVRRESAQYFLCEFDFTLYINILLHIAIAGTGIIMLILEPYDV